MSEEKGNLSSPSQNPEDPILSLNYYNIFRLRIPGHLLTLAPSARVHKCNLKQLREELLTNFPTIK